ncbi:unnamed protein product [Arctia plantaginis]|uniref:Uncharacterized protein n=1 Tax=Arctia plantaginis TaxID=874455 RepID=A0A8S0YTG8_ARCPL|nr:unnamed protein product [Arctia plantaginis]
MSVANNLVVNREQEEHNICIRRTQQQHFGTDDVRVQNEEDLVFVKDYCGLDEQAKGTGSKIEFLTT